MNTTVKHTAMAVGALLLMSSPALAHTNAVDAHALVTHAKIGNKEIYNVIKAQDINQHKSDLALASSPLLRGR